MSFFTKDEQLGAKMAYGSREVLYYTYSTGGTYGIESWLSEAKVRGGRIGALVRLWLTCVVIALWSLFVVALVMLILYLVATQDVLQVNRHKGVVSLFLCVLVSASCVSLYTACQNYKLALRVVESSKLRYVRLGDSMTWDEAPQRVIELRERLGDRFINVLYEEQGDDEVIECVTVVFDLFLIEQIDTDIACETIEELIESYDKRKQDALEERVAAAKASDEYVTHQHQDMERILSLY